MSRASPARMRLRRWDRKAQPSVKPSMANCSADCLTTRGSGSSRNNVSQPRGGGTSDGGRRQIRACVFRSRTIRHLVRRPTGKPPPGGSRIPTMIAVLTERSLAVTMRLIGGCDYDRHFLGSQFVSTIRGPGSKLIRHPFHFPSVFSTCKISDT